MKQNQEKKSLEFIIDQIPGRSHGFECLGLHGSDKAYFVSRLYNELKRPVFVIVPSSGERERFIEDLDFFSRSRETDSRKQKAHPAICFPGYNILPFKFLSYHNKTAAKRIRTLYRIAAGEIPQIVIATADVLLQKLIPRQELCEYAELIMAGEDIHRDILIKKLVSGGYVRSVIVEEPGDFCVRGGILDIFTPLYPDPLRIELFGDTVDSLRFFSAATQRTTQHIQEAVILPARETILKMESMNQVITRLRELAYDIDLPESKVRDIEDRIRNKGAFPGIESLISMIYPKLDTFFDYVPDNALFVLTEPAELDAAAEHAQKQIQNNYMTARNEGRVCVEPDSLYLKWSEAKSILAQKKPLALKTLSVLSPSEASIRHPVSNIQFPVADNTYLSMELRKTREKEAPLLPLANWIQTKKQSGITTVLVCGSPSQGKRLKSFLDPYNIRLSLAEGFPEIRRGVGIAYICSGKVSSGFVWPAESVAVITENEIFGPKRIRKKAPRQKIQTELLDYEDLKKGELIVHTEHGIGRYDGLVKLALNGNTNDFLLITYKDNDRLYLPVDRMTMTQKYMGVDGIEPVLDKMGGKSWEKVKSRVKKSVEKMAGDLLHLYAARKVKSGHAHGVPDDSFRDFEAGFPYEETPDQLRAIEDVLEDMQSPTVMDRLVCGDVGYGKTEVALRASLLAVSNGKQVAVLVPTTVLAEQHFKTFSSRFEDYPVMIECLSRFRSSKEQRAIISRIKEGKTDIVIGTHRLLQKDVTFKDLGLVVLDEEQRFGVRHKEKLKKMRKTVDVLALTATPIPRTLHLSLTGIRDISIISTPPDQRHAIITYISEFDDAVITEAIRKELGRNGQIYFVHNNIGNIDKMAAHLKDLAPEVRLGIVHGRLDEKELEEIMLRFAARDIDMLVCTTIIESGLDIPWANTILINRADRFGLAQIYQLRGRVGRSDEQAYAYLFIPGETTLTKDAQKRLKVLMEHSDLGSGFQIAMSDLRIRGGGTILGASQSGRIAAVGYDMFLKLMENAVSELKGEPVRENLEPEINVNMSAFISESYIPDIDQRLSAYRGLAKMTELREISDFKAELIDRFGVLPPETANLLLKIMLKVMSVKAGVKRLDLTEDQLLLYFSEIHQKKPFGIMDMVVSNQERFEFTQDQTLKIRLVRRGEGSPVVQTKNILKEISQRVNGQNFWFVRLSDERLKVKGER